MMVPPAVAAVAALAAATLSSHVLAGKKGDIRPPAVAGAFYPADPDELAGMVDGLLAGAAAGPVDGNLFALISPHAGYVYSGHVAAESYALLRGRDVNRVVVISPSHEALLPDVRPENVEAMAWAAKAAKV